MTVFFQQLASASQEWEALSPREREVLDMLARGLVKKEIADRLGVSVETVRTHCAHIYEKLHVNCRADAVAKIVPFGVLPPSTPLDLGDALQAPGSCD